MLSLIQLDAMIGVRVGLSSISGNGISFIKMERVVSPATSI